MTQPISRRSLLAATSAVAVGSMLPSVSFGAPAKMRLSVAFSETDLRAKAYKEFADSLKSDIEIEPHWSNSLFKQGTELVALQRGNLELCNLAPADISKQVPAWSLLTSAYLFRDYAHLKKTFESDVGKEFIAMARDQLNIEVIRPVYFGARQVNLKPDKVIKTPADLAGLKMRMPPGEYWQFLGESIGANPTPVAFSELYTALQTGVVDGQDNPLVTARTMKFDEVTTQFVLTSHVIGYDMLTVAKKSWDGMGKDLQSKFRATADKIFDANAAAYDSQAKDTIEYFKKEGKKVYEPDQNAFREYAQKKYLAKYGDVWPKGALEKINAVK